MFCKFIGSFSVVAVIFGLIFAGGVSASQDTGVIDLSEVDLSSLEPGDSIQVGDTEVRMLTPEEEAEELNRSNEPTYNIARSGCAQGAVAFTRSLDVTSEYRPLLEIYTELCQNSSGNYVVESIVAIGINDQFTGLSRGFGGTVDAEALNNGQTLFYLAQGDFYYHSSTTVGTQAGMNTKVASISFNSSSTSSYYSSVYQRENIYVQ